MEHYKISKWLNDFNCIKICDKNISGSKWLSSSQYSVNKNISFKTSMLRLDLCDYSDAYIVVKGRVKFKATPDTDVGWKVTASKNNATFRSCITKLSVH